MLLSITEVESHKFTMLGYAQADLHRRQDNEDRIAEHVRARARLIMRFTPFIWYEDRNLDPITLMQTVAGRLLLAVEEQRQQIAA